MNRARSNAASSLLGRIVRTARGERHGAIMKTDQIPKLVYELREPLACEDAECREDELVDIARTEDVLAYVNPRESVHLLTSLATVLGRMAEKESEAATQGLVELAKPGYPLSVRVAAIDALRNVGAGTDNVIGLLRELASEAQAAIRLTAQEALSSLETA